MAPPGPGRFLVALGFGILRIVTIVWFSNRLDRVDDLYGALGVATVFLAWLFIIARLLVAAISLNATLWHASSARRGDCGQRGKWRTVSRTNRSTRCSPGGSVGAGG